LAPSIVSARLKNNFLSARNNNITAKSSQNNLSVNGSKSRFNNSFYSTPVKKKRSDSPKSFTSYDEGEESDGVRQDKFGNKIIQGSKNHKICFVDEFYPHRSVKNVIIVENFKKYNREDYHEGNE